MTRKDLIGQMQQKKSCLCIGLDPEISKLPLHLQHHDHAIVDFCKEIIDSTHDLAVAYKPNIAFFECLGAKGWDMLEEIKAFIPEHIFTIADAKRGDIGNTSRMYAQCFFDKYNFDAITVAPYMGEDSVRPFLEFEDKWIILLGLTSNEGAQDFQQLSVQNKQLYEIVIEKASCWATEDQLMFVVGATKAESMARVREIVPNHFLLVPGIGAQGGDVHQTMLNGKNSDIGLLVNASRSILYASSEEDFALKAREEAKKLRNLMLQYFD